MKMKKTITAVLLLSLVLITVYNVIHVYRNTYDMKRTPFSSVNEEACMWDSIQGQFVLVSKSSGFLDFPFCFGERYCLYDIEEDRLYYIGSQLTPFAWLGWKPILSGNHVLMYSTGDDITDAIWWTYIDLNTLNKVEMVAEPDTYCISRDRIFYLEKGDLEDNEKSEVYVMNFTDLRPELFRKEHISSLSLLDDILYWTNPKKKEISLYNILNGDIRVYPDTEDAATIIQPIDEDHFAVFYESGKINLFTEGKPSELCNTSCSFFLGYSVTAFHNGSLFWYDDDTNIISSIDLETGKEKIFFDLSHVPLTQGQSDNYGLQVSFSEEYVALEIEHRSEKKEWIYVIDYSGNVLRSRRLS